MSVLYERKSLKELHDRQRYLRQREDAAAIAFVVLAESGQIDDVTASEQSLLFEEWKPKINYVAGQLRKFDGVLYRCLQTHTSQVGWEPTVAVSVWVPTSDPAEEWPAWSQPISSVDAYSQGAKVSHMDGHWISGVNGNVWEPGTVDESIWRKEE